MKFPGLWYVSGSQHGTPQLVQMIACRYLLCVESDFASEPETLHIWVGLELCVSFARAAVT